MENVIKISEDELNNIIEKCEKMSGIDPRACEVDWMDYKLHVKRFLSFQDMMEFVNGVVAGCFAKSDNSYIPEARDFFFRCHIIAYYTNMELPENLEDKNRIAYGTNIIETILRNVDMGQLQAIIDSIDKKVSFLVNANVKQITDEAEMVCNQLTGLYSMLAEAFSGIDKETMTAVAQAISGHDFDEAKFAEAIISARNSDNGASQQ